MRFIHKLFSVALLVILGTAVGCPGPADPPSDEKVKELNQQMDNDMSTMTLPKNPAAKK